MTLDTTAREQAMQARVGDIVAHLQDVFGQNLTAYAAGLTDAGIIVRIARGEECPTADVEAQLRRLFHVVVLLEQVESADTIRAWFIGMNPYLDDITPARMIREDTDRVLQAARRLLADG